MTANKKEEIKLVCRVQALYSRLYIINGDLIRLEAEIEALPNIDLSAAWAKADDENMPTPAEADGAVRKLFLSSLKGKLENERVSIEAEIESI